MKIVGPFRSYRLHSVPCWCGAGVGERCRDREGRPSTVHRTRGRISPEQVNIMLRAAGAEPLPEEEPDQ